MLQPLCSRRARLPVRRDGAHPCRISRRIAEHPTRGTPYGRTGTFWASERAGRTADLVCTGEEGPGRMRPMGASRMTIGRLGR